MVPLTVVVSGLFSGNDNFVELVVHTWWTQWLILFDYFDKDEEGYILSQFHLPKHVESIMSKNEK